MSDQIVDQRLEALLRQTLKAEVASLPMRVTADQVMDRVTARGARSGLLGRVRLNRFALQVAAVTVMVVAAFGIGLWVSRPSVVGPSPLPSASPTASTPSVDLGIFEPISGWIVYGDDSGIWGVDPREPGASPSPVRITTKTGVPLDWSKEGTQLLVRRDNLLFVMHSDESETQVTEPPLVVRDAAIAPDGSRVVFVAGSPDVPRAAALYAVDAAGGPAEMLAESRFGNIEAVTFSPDGTRVAYADGAGDNNHHVFVMNADGSDAHEIAFQDCACHVRGLEWSPAGDRIALGLEGAIYTFTPDGAGLTRIIETGDEPHWSRDGSQIDYEVTCLHDANGCGLATAMKDGSDVLRFTHGHAGPWHPGTLAQPSPLDLGIFEPVAGWIVYANVNGFANAAGIWAIDPVTLDPETRVRLTPELGDPVAWSSDGSKLLVQRDLSDVALPDGLFVLNADGTEIRLGNVDDRSRSFFTPDGSQVVYDDGDDMYVVDVEGGTPELLLTGAPPWWTLSPDGTQIAYVPSPNDHSNTVWLMDADGSDAHQIVSNESNEWPGHVRGLAWSPAGDRIALALGGFIYTFAPDGTGFTEVAGSDATCGSAPECPVNLQMYGTAPLWSPDGSQITYMTGCIDGRFSCGIAIVNADGTNRRNSARALSGPWHPGTGSRTITPSSTP